MLNHDAETCNRETGSVDQESRYIVPHSFIFSRNATILQKRQKYQTIRSLSAWNARPRFSTNMHFARNNRLFAENRRDCLDI